MAPGRSRVKAKAARPFGTSLAAFCVILGIGTLGCDSGAKREGGDDGTRTTTSERPIEMLVANDAETLDPRHATDAVALRASRLLHAGLVRLDPDTLEPRPSAAQSWAWIDPQALRVVLRDGVRFHSGRPLVADDVVATIRAFASPRVGSRHANVVEAIDRVEADSPSSVVIRLKRPHGTLLTDLEIPILRADEAESPPRPDGSLDGLGPYVVARRDAGEIALSPARTSVRPTPARRAVTLRTVHDENARALRMHAGRADLVINGFSPTLLPALERAPGVIVTARPGANLTYMVMRTDRGPLADVRVRQSLALAIDRARIARTLLAGRAQPATTLMPESHWAYTPPPSAQVTYDLTEARARLAPLRADSGAPLHLTLLTSTDRLRGTIARLLAQDLAEIGIELEVVPLELGTMLTRLGAGDFELATLQMPELTEPNVLRVFLHSSLVPPAGANRGRVHDPDLDRMLDEGARETDPSTRRATYASLEALVRDRLPIIPLWHEDQVTVASPRAASFRPSAEGRWSSLADLE